MPATPAQLVELPECLRQHSQSPGDFCAVSGFECIGKLEGFLAPDQFPLQSNPANIHKGFEPAHWGYLTEHGINPTDQHLGSGAEAARIITSETDADRFPLVSMAVQNDARQWGYHVFVFVRHCGVLLFIDPAIPCVILKGRDQLAVALENWRVNSPLRNTIHILTYRN